MSIARRRPVRWGLALMLTSLAFAMPLGGSALAAEPVPEARAIASPQRSYALRLRPGQDLRQELIAFAKREHLKAGFVLTTVGSLTQAKLRLANQSDLSTYQGHFEIVSLVGTLSEESSHLHLSVSDETGKTLGGHLVDGNLIYTTAEIVIGELEGLTFSRETDPVSTYKELVIRKRETAR